MSIQTARLKLVPATAEMLRAELQDPRKLAALLGVKIPQNWPPELYDSNAIEYTLSRLSEHAEPSTWWCHYFVREPTPTGPAVAVGAGGYKGPPRNGTVEVGYSVLSEYRRKGYASEATLGLVAHAFAPGILPKKRLSRPAALKLSGWEASAPMRNTVEPSALRLASAVQEAGASPAPVSRDVEQSRSWYHRMSVPGRGRRPLPPDRSGRRRSWTS